MRVMAMPEVQKALTKQVGRRIDQQTRKVCQVDSLTNSIVDKSCRRVVYESEDSQLPNADTWKAASDKGKWCINFIPHLMTRLHGMFKSMNR